MKVKHWPALFLAAALLAPATMRAADDPAPGSFAWRATLATDGQSGLLRVPLPGDALARLQTRNAADLRVFDGQGQPLAFALARPPRPADAPRQQSPAFAALPLYAAAPGARPPQGSLRMKVEQNGQQQSVWVNLGAGGKDAATRSQRLPAALFDTRAQKDPVSGFVVKAQLPANVPVQLTLSTSPDLAHWTPVGAPGRIYRFEGAGAPVNDKLELAAPLALKDQYLRLDWSGQEGVVVESVVGLLAAGEAKRDLPGVALPAGFADGPGALEWQLGFATPIARLELSTSRANTLVPLRLLGRNQASEPWRLLGQTVVYRLGPAGQESTNPPAVMHGTSLRWLRIESTHGTRLDGLPLAARVLFEPLELVFPAGATGPYQLAAGRADTPASALPLSALAAATTTQVEALPAARMVAVQAEAPSAPTWFTRALPRGVDGKTAGLWLVLALGVLMLGGVAWALLRQVTAARGETADRA